MQKFNLLDESWIPVLMLDGTRTQLSLHDVFSKVSLIRRIEDTSPLVTLALHRLLLAILYRSLQRPISIDDAKTLLESGLPLEPITEYLMKWHDKFWLFHPEYPFYQVPNWDITDVEKLEMKPWIVLDPTENDQNRPMLWSHRSFDQPGPCTLDKIARLLVAYQSTVITTGKSALTNCRAAPAANALRALPVGKNLQDTLIFLLVPQHKDVMDADLPMWERPLDTVHDLAKTTLTNQTGLADLYTWRSRAVLLFQGEETITLYTASGRIIDNNTISDPMVCRDKEKGFLLLPEHKRIWQEYDSIIPSDGMKTPGVINHVLLLCRHKMDRFPAMIMVGGIENKQAKPLSWQFSVFAFPPEISTNIKLRTAIRKFLTATQTGAEVLLEAVIATMAFSIKNGSNVSSRDKTSLKKTAQQSTVLTAYWAQAEALFLNIINTADTENRVEILQKLTTDIWHEMAPELSQRIPAIATGTIELEKQMRNWQKKTKKSEASS